MKSFKLITQLFKEGNHISSFPFRMVYLLSEGKPDSVQAGFSVSSRNFKKAVHRNRIKRLTREAYRLQKHPLTDLMKKENKNLFLFFIYTGKELPDFFSVKEKINVIIGLLIKKIIENKQDKKE